LKAPRLTYLFLLFFIVSNAQIKSGKSGTYSQAFIENKGQWDASVSYLNQSSGLNTWILNDGNMLLDYHRINMSQGNKVHTPFDSDSITSIAGHRLLLNWINGSEEVPFTSQLKQETYNNYFIGNDPTKHATNVGLFKKIIGQNLYSGIDIDYYFEGNNMRYDLILKPYADASNIRLKVKGANKISINSHGNVSFLTELGEIQLQDLFVYELESKKEIAATWKLVNSDELFFEIGDYDKSKTLIIDPIIYSTFVGGDSYQNSMTIKSDNTGNAYIGGKTSAINFLITPGAYQTSLNLGPDTYIAKINSTGTNYIFNTFIGGNSTDILNDIAIDSIGNIYATGLTQSDNFPTTSGAFQTVPSSPGPFNAEVFILKLNSIGSNLIYATYLGGSEGEVGNGIAIDQIGCAYVCGSTISNDFDISPSAYQVSVPGPFTTTCFLTKINPTGSTLIYSTYLGGAGSENIAYDVAVDLSECAYITGYSASYGTFITPGVYSSGSGGAWSAFVTKFNQSGSNLIYSTCIGGDGPYPAVNSEGHGIDVDASGNAYVTGFTLANDFTTTTGAFQTIKGDTLLREGFVFKLNPSATTLLYSSFLGGNGEDFSIDIDIDNFGSAYLIGNTNSLNFPTTSDAFQSNLDSVYDVFFSKLSPNGAYLQYSTYFGGDNFDFGYGITQKNSTDLYLTGVTRSPDFDITTNVIDSVISSFNSTIYEDGFATKFTICPPINFDIVTQNTSCYNIDDGSAFYTLQAPINTVTAVWSNGQSTDTIQNLASGTYFLTISNSNGCSVTDTFEINSPDSISIDIITSNNNFCFGDTTLVYSTNPDSTISINYQWFLNGNLIGANDSILSATFSNNDSIYCIGSTSASCSASSDTIIFIVNSNSTPTIDINTTSNDTICAGTQVTFNAVVTNSGTSPIFQWQINGINVGTNTNSFTLSTLNNGDFVSCILTSSLNCLASNNIVSDSLLFYVNPNLSPSVSISANNSVICPGDMVQFTSVSTNGGSNPLYTWQINGITVGGNSSSLSSSTLVNNDIVTLVLLSNETCVINNPGSSNSISITVNTCLPPTANFSVSDNQICVDNCISYTNFSVNNATSWLWQFAGGSPSSSSLETPPTICYLSPGVFPVTLIVSNQYGNDTITQLNYIAVIDNIPVTISGPTQIGSCEEADLAASPADGTYLWGPAIFNSCITCSNTTVSPNSSQQYWVTYTSPNGCVSRDTIDITVENIKSHFVPTGLSPNGDNVNDTLFFHGLGIDKFKLQIYDRIGELVFETENFEKGWDGTYLGMPMNNNVFVYQLEVYFCDGERIIESGNVTIVK
jgi:gliding motility-associated-like protein